MVPKTRKSDVPRRPHRRQFVRCGIGVNPDVFASCDDHVFFLCCALKRRYMGSIMGNIWEYNGVVYTVSNLLNKKKTEHNNPKGTRRIPGMVNG